MLARLTINNYALIDALDISFPKHLVIITGQTGAGKSILLGALSLLLGARADSDVICDRSRNCVVEAQFIDDDGQERIVRRVVTPQGRSRAFIDDMPVTLDELKTLTSSLVDIHSQNSQTMLGDAAFQRKVLDAFAGNTVLLSRYEAAYRHFRELGRELADLEQRVAQSVRNHDYLQFQFDQLAKAALEPGELERLEKEQLELANAEDLKLSLRTALDALDNERSDVQTALKEAIGNLSRAARVIDRLEPLLQRLESSRIELKDIVNEIDSEQEKISVDDARLEAVENRIALIYDLMRKHEVEGVDELLALKDSLQASLQEGDDLGERLAGVRRELDEADKLCAELSAELHSARLQAAPELSQVLQSSIRGLEMPFAAFSVQIDALPERGPAGEDAVRFFFSAAGDDRPKELSKVASGGELSRIMLCVKALMAQHVQMPTMIFDEIDVGVSGSVADKMGRMIVGMGDSMQVIAITHLPQVASKGNAHYLVYKEIGDDRVASSKIRKIEGEERAREIARMLSGQEVTPEALANARVLLGQ
ncbi:MAG: DNA repair protein RecN [Bacteroidales bacterium]|nr:DNA repair protein RecN [Bacteroidales bacterium]